MLVLSQVEVKTRTFLQLLVLLALGLALAACQPTPTPAPPTPLPTVAATPTTAEVESLLHIEITSEPAEDSMAFHVTLTNLASWEMTDVVATAIVPRGTTLLEAYTEIPGVTSSFGEHSCSFTLPRLAAGETVELFTYRVEAKPGMFISTQASASWQGKVPGQVTSEPVEISIAVPIQPPAPRITTLALCAEVSEDGLCTSPTIEFQPDVTIYYVFTYENLSPSDDVVERWYLGEEVWTEATLNTDYIIKEGGASGRFASSGINLTASEWERLGSASTGRLELWLNGELALTIEFTVTAAQPTGLIIAPDIAERIAQLQPIDMSQTLDLDDLEDWEVAVLDKLIQAAAYMDAAFWQQADPEGAVLYQKLAGTTDPQLQDARLLMGVHFGRWDRFREFEPFVGTDPHPDGAFFYPPDLTREELDQYIAEHPDEKDTLLSPFTVVRREDDRLVSIPYHEIYAPFVLPAADLLEQAADLAQNESLKTYLTLQAQALRTDDYYEANLAWLDLDSRLDFIIAPHEVYNDQLTGQKAAYEGVVMVVDRAASATLDQFKATIPTLQANLPVPADYKPDQTGALTPMEIVQNVYRAGDMRAGNQYIAFSLPNDPRVWEAKGVKKVMMRNFLEARQQVVLAPLVEAVLDEETAKLMSADAFFTWVLMHEVSHTLGPRTVQQDGEELTVRQALGEYYPPIEEGKADIVGLYNLVYLRGQGLVTVPVEAHYVGYLAEALRAMRFGSKSAYGLIRSAAWNYLVEQGALRFDAASSRFSLDAAKMAEAVEKLATHLLTIEGQGDTKAAKAFLDQYAYVSPELQALLDKANETVPIEFVPRFTEPPVVPRVGAATDVQALLDNYVQMPWQVDTSGLSASEQAVLAKLIQAADYMEEIYWRQRSVDGAALRDRFELSDDPEDQALAHLLRLNAGPYDILSGEEPIIGGQSQLPPGAALYPDDLTAEELEEYVAAHPDAKDALLSPCTVVRRDGDKLVAVPYHQEYAVWLEPAARLLEEAAALTEEPSLRIYLLHRAQALRTDDYFQSDVDWVRLEGNLDVVIGPIEVYIDDLMGAKASYHAIVMVKDPVETAKLASYLDYLDEMQANLPVEEAGKPSVTGLKSPLVVVRDVYRSGDIRHGPQVIAFVLPNDPRVRAQEGSKKVMLKPMLDAKAEQMMIPIAQRILAEDQVQYVTAQGAFDHVLLHEISHALGPKQVAGTETTVNAALKDRYSPIEELKADIVGLYNLAYLQDQGFFNEAMIPQHYASYLAGLFRGLRFGTTDAHGMARLMQFNYLLEHGGITFDQATGRYRIEMDQIDDVVADLAGVVLTIETEGDYEGAGALLDQYGQVTTQVQATLDALADLPVDIEPIYPIAGATPTAQATLLVYNTVERLLAGDLLHTVTITDVQANLADYPPDWPVVGVGTTDWIGRNGEMMPDGTVGDLRFWWADPNSLTQADVRDLADPTIAASLDHDVRYPFLGLAVGDPETSITWSLQDVENVHAWLEEEFETSDVDLAGVQLRGQFGPVKTTVAYNIPLTGLDLRGGYVGEDHFRFSEYVTATWTMNGLYAADPDLHTVVSTAGHPLHLHGYQTETLLGGHVGSASAISVTATVWPLSQVITRSGELRLETFYTGAFRRAVQAHFADPTQFHDPHGLMTLGLLHDQLVAEFGQAQYDDWLAHAIAEACLIKTDDGWAGAHVLQPDLPALPSCGSKPQIHFTAELILALAWNGLDEIRRPGWGEELVVPRSELVHWLQRHVAVDPWSPSMETQALIVAGVPLTQTWQAANGETWNVNKLLEDAITQWRENREKADLMPGDIVPENMLHLAPALIDLFARYPETIATYGPVLDEVLAAYESALHPDGYWGFPGETVSTGHIVEQYIRAQKAGLNIALPSLRPVKLMVEHQAADGWFDIHNAPFIGAQAHGVRALGVTMPLFSSP